MSSITVTSTDNESAIICPSKQSMNVDQSRIQDAEVSTLRWQPDTPVPTNTRRCGLKWGHLELAWTVPYACFTLGIPSLHRSFASGESRLGKSTNRHTHWCIDNLAGRLGLPATIIVWKTIRNFASLLVVAMIAAIFKQAIQVGETAQLLIYTALNQAALGLVYSNILMIYFSSHNRVRQHDHGPVDVEQLKYLLWNIWDLFSTPAMWTAWSMITLVTALLIEVVQLGILGSPGQGVYPNPSSARLVSSLSIGVSAFNQTIRMHEP